MSLLPIELLGTIVSLSDAADLPALARTSVALQPLAESFLYQCVVLNDAQGPCDARALSSMIAQPKRHRYLRALVIDKLVLQVTLSTLVRRALSLAHNLIFLSLTRLSAGDTSALLHACASTQLLHLTVGTDGNGSNGEQGAVAGPHLAAWLDTRPDLKEFIHTQQWQSLPNHANASFPLAEAALPRLCIVAAHGSLLERIVPGRPVVFAALDYPMAYNRAFEVGGGPGTGGADYLRAMRALRSSTGPLHTLSIQFRRGDTFELHPFATFLQQRDFELPSVRVLDLFMGYTWFHVEILFEICLVLHAFPHLTTLRLITPSALLSSYTYQLQSVVDTWHAHCHSLTRVTLREHHDDADADDRDHDDMLGDPGEDSGMHEYALDANGTRLVREDMHQGQRPADHTGSVSSGNEQMRLFSGDNPPSGYEVHCASLRMALRMALE